MIRVKKTVIIWLCMVLAVGACSFCDAVGEASVSRAVYAASKDKVSKAYEKKLAKLVEKKKYKSGIKSAQLSCGKGKKILVVAPASAVYFGGQTTEVDVYQYVGGKVKHIGAVSSSGTAYPIMYTKEAILFGGSHKSGKLVINKGKGVLYEITKMNYNQKKPVLSKYNVKAGKRTKVSSKEITAKKAESLDYYLGQDAAQSKLITLK